MTNGMWNIWSNEHRMWWKAHSLGYTRSRANAGRYSQEEAIKIVSEAGVSTIGMPENCVDVETPNETMFPCEPNSEAKQPQGEE